MKTTKIPSIILWCSFIFSVACSQSKPSESEDEISQESSVKVVATKRQIKMDLAHKPVFWNDPKDMVGKPVDQVERINYMTDQLLQNTGSLNAEVSYLKQEIGREALENCDLLFIHIPSAKYSSREVKAIQEYIENGGSLFLVMDVDYWSTLDQTNVNDLIKPFGIEYGENSPDSLAGGYTKASPITNNRFKISYHGSRIVKGGTPFCYSVHTNEYPFGVYKELKSGGKLVAMGDGMTSLYMTSWQDVDDYQCLEFMEAVLRWLLR